MLISLHIPKTAGTAWRLLVEANNAGQASFTSDLPRDADGPAMTALRAVRAGKPDEARAAIDKSGTQLIHGHEVREILPLLPDAGLIAWIRDPIDRLESEYRHRLTRPVENELDAKLQAGDVSVLEFASYFTHLYQDVVTLADQRPGPFSFFVQEEIDPALAVIRDTLHWRGNLPKRNVTPTSLKSDHIGLTQTEHTEVRRMLQGEYALYNAWRGDWQSGRAAAPAREALLTAPPARPPAPGQAWRRRLGVQIERLGRLIGRDWR